MKIKDIILTFLVFLLIASLFKIKDDKGKYQEQEKLYLSSLDTISISKNKNKEYVARISVLESNNIETFTRLIAKDSAIVKLKSLINTYKNQLKTQGSGTIHKTKTKVDTIIKSEVVYKDSFPIYKGKVELGKWVLGDITASYNNISLGLEINNEYSLVVGREPTGFLGLGAGKPFAEVTNHNPYTKTTSLRTYQVSLPKPSKFSIGVIGGYGFSGNVTPGIILGVGVSYNLINF